MSQGQRKRSDLDDRIKTDSRITLQRRSFFREDLYFGNFGTAPCSKKLKMNQTFEYVQEMISAGYLPILYFGIDYKEARRAPRIAYNYKHNVDIFEDGVETRFPLIGELNGTAINGAQLLNGTNYLEKGEMPRMTNPIVYDCIASLGGFTSVEHDLSVTFTEQLYGELLESPGVPEHVVKPLIEGEDERGPGEFTQFLYALCGVEGYKFEMEAV